MKHLPEIEDAQSDRIRMKIRISCHSVEVATQIPNTGLPQLLVSGAQPIIDELVYVALVQVDQKDVFFEEFGEYSASNGDIGVSYPFHHVGERLVAQHHVHQGQLPDLGALVLAHAFLHFMFEAFYFASYLNAFSIQILQKRTFQLKYIIFM